MVIAGDLHVEALSEPAGIKRARVAIIQRTIGSKDTSAINAGVARTGGAVIAGLLDMQAFGIYAGVNRAGVIVIQNAIRSGDTGAIIACIIRAGIAVITVD